MPPHVPVLCSAFRSCRWRVTVCAPEEEGRLFVGACCARFVVVIPPTLHKAFVYIPPAPLKIEILFGNTAADVHVTHQSDFAVSVWLPHLIFFPSVSSACLLSLSVCDHILTFGASHFVFVISYFFMIA